MIVPEVKGICKFIFDHTGRPNEKILNTFNMNIVEKRKTMKEKSHFTDMVQLLIEAEQPLNEKDLLLEDEKKGFGKSSKVLSSMVRSFSIVFFPFSYQFLIIIIL